MVLFRNEKEHQCIADLSKHACFLENTWIELASRTCLVFLKKLKCLYKPAMQEEQVFFSSSRLTKSQFFFGAEVWKPLFSTLRILIA